MHSSELMSTVIPVTALHTRPLLSVVEFCRWSEYCKLPVKYHTRMRTLMSSSPAGHVTPTCNSFLKIAHKGFPSNCQIFTRHALKKSCCKLYSTQKIVVKLFQQLVTEHTKRLHSLVQCTPPTGYRVSLPSSIQPAVS